jgi:hypothetical protein
MPKAPSDASSTLRLEHQASSEPHVAVVACVPAYDDPAELAAIFHATLAAVALLSCGAHTHCALGPSG